MTARFIVGGGLIGLACAAVYAGGLAFTALVAFAALLMFAEWSVMHGINRSLRLAGLAVLAAVCAITPYGPTSQAIIVLAAASGLLGLFARSYGRQRAIWLACGLLYCGLPAIALLWMRLQSAGAGLTAWVLFVVWATDIAAFFTGRAVGGRPLAPKISPNKTISGLVGGVLAAGVVGTVAARPLGLAVDPLPFGLAVLGGSLAVVAQGGDLFESWLKRRAGVKNSGTLLPGHGGVLDRLDGLVPSAILAAVFFALVAR